MSDGLNLLGSILDHNSTITLELLDESFFTDEELPVFNYVQRHRRRFGELPNWSTVTEDTGVEIPETDESVDYYFGKVHDRRLHNSVIEPFRDLRSALAERNMEQVRDTIRELQSVSTRYSPERQLQDLAQVGDELIAHYDEIKNNLDQGLTGIPTGWNFLDEQSGGYQPGDLIFWVARPSMGKTYLLLWQAYTAWLMGYHVLFISMEMALRNIGNRLFAMHCGVNPDALRKARLSSWTEREVKTRIREISDSDRFKLYAGNFGKSIAELDGVIQDVSPDIVYIDGAYLMKPDPRPGIRMGRYDATAYVVDDLRTMTLQRNRCIVASTQFGRDAGKGGKRGSLENIGYTDTIGTHSTMVLSIKDPPETTLDPARTVEILKGREGEQGRFGTFFQFAPTRFDDFMIVDDEEQSRAHLQAEQRRQRMGYGQDWVIDENLD